jgi:hypothetical protein
VIDDPLPVAGTAEISVGIASPTPATVLLPPPLLQPTTINPSTPTAQPATRLLITPASPANKKAQFL